MSWIPGLPMNVRSAGLVNRSTDVIRSDRFALVLVIVLGFAWMLLLGLFLPINYDEYTQVHSAWLVSQGLKPYTDFHAVHPPFLWFLFSPIIRLLPERFESIIFFLRIINLAFSTAILIVMAYMLMRRFQGRVERCLALGAMSIMCTHPRVLRALAELRVDHLGAALTLLALCVATRGDRKRPSSQWFFSGFLFAVAMGLSAKLLLIPIATGILLGLEEARKGKRALGRYLLAGAGGIGFGLSIMVSICIINGVNIRRLSEQVFAYHALLRETFTQEYGLAESLFDHARQQFGRPIVVLLLGVIVLIHEGIRGRWLENRVPFIAATYALLQPLWVPFPHKQYAYTIYLVWTFPLALALVKIWRSNYRKAVTLTVCLLGMGVYFEGVRGYRIVTRDEARQDIGIGNALLQLSPPGQPVAAQPPFHPIFRRDSTFFWIYSHNPRGPETEEIMSRFPAYGERFSYKGYLEELKANPPGLIVPNTPFVGREYRRALNDFLKEFYPEGYTLHRVGRLDVFVKRDGSG